eukprot:243610_1
MLMYMRRNIGKRTRNAFQEIFKSQNKSHLRLIRSVVIALCLFTILLIIGYQLYSLQSYKYQPSRVSEHKSEMQSFMDPHEQSPTNNELRHKQEHKFKQNKEHNSYKYVHSISTVKQLNSVKTPPSELRTTHESIEDSELIPYTQLSWEEQCESSSFHDKHFYDNTVDEEAIDFIFPADDAALYDMLHSDEFLNHWDTSTLNTTYWKLIAKLDKEHKKDVKALRAKYDAYNNAHDARRRLTLTRSRAKDVSKYFDFNGLTSDLTLYYKRTPSVGP